MPEEAYFSPEAAVALLRRKDRSVLALSYRWLTSGHADPAGVTLALVRRYLRGDPSTAGCGLFCDYASLPQRGMNGEERSAEDTAVFIGDFMLPIIGIKPRQGQVEGTGLIDRFGQGDARGPVNGGHPIWKDDFHGQIRRR